MSVNPRYDAPALVSKTQKILSGFAMGLRSQFVFRFHSGNTFEDVPLYLVVD